MLQKLFPRNVHNIERIVRVLVGIGILSLAFVGPATPWAFIGIVPIATGPPAVVAAVAVQPDPRG